MTEATIRLRAVPGTWVARAGGAVIAETRAAQELTERDHDPVIYFPRGDVAMAFLEVSGSQSRSEARGPASHFTLVAKSGPIRDAAWSYEAPAPALAAIAGHIAFDPTRVTVERV